MLCNPQKAQAPPFHTVGKIGKSKTIASICGYVSTSIPNTVGSPPPVSEIGCPLGVGGGADKLWIDITSAVWQLATRCLILGVGFRGQAIQWRDTRDRGSKGRCHGNQFWDCISCKWTLTEDNDMRLSCKGRLHCGDGNCSRLSGWELTR